MTIEKIFKTNFHNEQIRQSLASLTIAENKKLQLTVIGGENTYLTSETNLILSASVSITVIVRSVISISVTIGNPYVLYFFFEKILSNKKKQEHFYYFFLKN